MAYIIGNTTVIDNNAALGAVSGNSLNLANNTNLPSGGASTIFLTSTNNQANVGSGYTYLIGQGGGGGGGRSNDSQAFAPDGGAGGVGFAIANVSGGGNATFTIGAGGLVANTQGAAGQDGGVTQYTGNQNLQFGRAGEGGLAGGPSTLTSPNGFTGSLTNQQAPVASSQLFAPTGSYGNGGEGGRRVGPYGNDGSSGVLFAIG